MTYSPVIMQGLSFFQHIGEIFKMDKVIDVIGKTFFVFVRKVFQILQLSGGTLGLPVQQNVNSRSLFLTLSRCLNLPFYLIIICFFFHPSRDLKSLFVRQVVDRQRLVCFCAC